MKKRGAYAPRFFMEQETGVEAIEDILDTQYIVKYYANDTI